MLRKLRIFFTFLGIILLIETVVSDKWDSFGDRIVYAAIAIGTLVICQPTAFFGFLRWIVRIGKSASPKACIQPDDAPAITTQYEEEQGPDLIISSQAALAQFTQQYTVIDEIRTKVVGVTFRNDDGTNRQSILAHCHPGDEISLRYYEYHGSPAYGVQTENGQIGNISQELAWDLGEYGDDVYVAGRILEVTGGYDGLYFGCNIVLTIFGPK